MNARVEESDEKLSGSEATKESEALRVLAILEAESITGPAQAVLELANEAHSDSSNRRRLEITVALFARRKHATSSGLMHALEAAGIPFFMISEKSGLDASLHHKIRELCAQSRARVIWTNSVTSHLMVRLSGVQQRCKWVAFHHGYGETNLKRSFYSLFDWVSLRKADRVIAACLPFANQLTRRGVHKSRIRIQHMPIRRLEKIAGGTDKLRSELGLGTDEKVVLSIGTLSHKKGYRNLLKAFVLLRDKTGDEKLRLVLVGDGPERSRLERHARRLGAEKQIVFTGHRDDSKSFFGLADAFALPSLREGTPNVLLESMAAGVPAVATAVGGIPDLAENEDALLVSKDDPAALADALKMLMQSSALGEALTAAAEEVVDAHTPQIYYERMRAIFLDAAGLDDD